MDDDVQDSRPYPAQERALKQELARLQQERRTHRLNRGRLDRVLEGYQQRHMAMARLSAAEVQRFHHLHERLADTVRAQAELVGRLTRVARVRRVS